VRLVHPGARAYHDVMSDTAQLLVITNFPDAAQAAQAARALVDERLAACINVLPPMHSVYRWEGAVETAEEHLLLIKARRADYARLEDRIRALHPYDVPEVIATPIVAGLPAYLAWIDAPDGTA
jgi:periplasmic divalent cation tolerance protein